MTDPTQPTDPKILHEYGEKAARRAEKTAAHTALLLAWGAYTNSPSVKDYVLGAAIHKLHAAHHLAIIAETCGVEVDDATLETVSFVEIYDSKSDERLYRELVLARGQITTTQTEILGDLLERPYEMLLVVEEYLQAEISARRLLEEARKSLGEHWAHRFDVKTYAGQLRLIHRLIRSMVEKYSTVLITPNLDLHDLGVDEDGIHEMANTLLDEFALIRVDLSMIKNDLAACSTIEEMLELIGANFPTGR